jgi:hypothetical protein
MIIFFILFFIVYTAVNYYIFRKGWQVLGKSAVLKTAYIIAFVVIAYSYIFTKVLDNYLPPLAYDIIYTIGVLWFPFLFYFFLFLLFLDINVGIFSITYDG